MKKLRMVFMAAAALCVLGMTGCAGAPEPTGSESGTVQTIQSTPTATVQTTAASTTVATAESVITPSSSPVPTATLPPGIWEEARFRADLDGDGENETILVYVVQEYREFFDGIFVGVLGKSEYEEILVDEGNFVGAYLTHAPSGALCVVISCDNAVNGQGITTLCSFSGLFPELNGRTAGVVEQMDGVNMTLSDWTDFIGSRYYTRNYKLTNDFTLEPVSEYMFDTDGTEPLHTIRNLPVEMLVDGVYVEDTLPAGTYLWPVSSDGYSYMTFRLEDGRKGRITYTRGEYAFALISGVSEFEYFDNTDYWSQCRQQISTAKHKRSVETIYYGYDIAERSLSMKKWNRAIFAVLTAICLLVMPGCSQLFSMHDRPTPTVEPSPTATETAEATSTPQIEEPTPSPTEEPTPTAAPTLAPLPKDLIELARFAVDIDGDGAEETVVVATTDEDYGLVYVGVLTSEGFERVLAADESEGWLADAYLGAAPNGAPCLLTSVDISSDDYITSVFAFSGGKPVLKDELEAYVSQVSGSSVTVRDDLFVIGSWMYTCEYRITAAFKLERVSEMMIDTEDREPMHTVLPLPVEMLVDGVYTAQTLPAGTLLIPVATDCETYVSFTLQDGLEGRILFAWDDWQALICGVPADDYFDNLEYWD